MSESYGLHWFRRDLRVAGNAALQWSWKEHGGRVLGVFCFDHRFLSREDFSPARFQFFLKTLESLRAELREAGGDLLFLDVGPDEAFESLFARLRGTRFGLPATVSFNRDYEPFARERDARLTRLFEERFGLRTHSERDHLVLEPHEVGKDDGSPYVVYTPFKKRWLARLAEPEVRARVRKIKARGEGKLFSMSWEGVLGATPDLLPEYLEKNGRLVRVPLPEAGTAAALARLREFGKSHSAYAEARDIPSVAGTSRLSIYLKNGSITVPQIVAELGLADAPADKVLSELVWREFYYSILFHFPSVETEAFNPRYRAVAWENREDLLAAWKEGRTGYPIVDAGMRQLAATGWMHNRVRMIVASFLTKDLHVDWRRGERWFMRELLDGDLAPNNGGWQWAASTGCDPQPYFRVFNPTLQGKRFDPEGEYVRRWVPELAGVDASVIHEPRDPVVEHGPRARRAIELFKQAASR